MKGMGGSLVTQESLTWALWVLRRGSFDIRRRVIHGNMVLCAELSLFDLLTLPTVWAGFLWPAGSLERAGFWGKRET